MSALDIIILVCLIPAIYQGITKGFVSQVVGIVSVFLGAWMAFHSSNAAFIAVAPSLPDTSPALIHIISFLVFFILYALVINLLGKLIEKLLKLVMLGWLNRVLGFVFSIAYGLLIISLLLVLFTSLNNTFEFVSQETLAESMLYQPLYDFGSALFPYLKALIFSE
jgi:membrane protein required for colicin V production